MANPSGSVSKAPLQLGKLTPEDAERLASMFRPAWELDDAPFAQGTTLSAAEMDALTAGAGVAPEVAAVINADKAHAAPRVPPAAHRPTTPDDSVVIDVEPDPTPPPAPAPMRPQHATVRLKRDAAAKVTAESGAYAPIKKSNTGLFIGIGAVVALVGIIGIVKAMSGSSDTAKSDGATATTATDTTQQGPHIPPPPPIDTAAAVATSDTAATTDTAAPADTAPAPTETAHATPPPPVVTHTAPAPTHKTPATHTTHTVTTHHTKPPTHKGSGAIVRDNPF